VLAHIPQVTNILRREAVDLSEIDRNAKSNVQNPVSELKQFMCGNGKEMAFGMKGVSG